VDSCLNKLLSKQDLCDAGWEPSSIERILDGPDEVEPAGHWLNTSGKPMYLRERVAVAEYRTGRSKRRPNDQRLRKWLWHPKPTCMPLATFDFHRIADRYVPGVAQTFWSLRLSHPVAGRRPGTREDEVRLISEVLGKIITVHHRVMSSKRDVIANWFNDHASTFVNRVGQKWSSGLIVRSVERASYVSRGVGPKTTDLFLGLLALVHVGNILGPDRKRISITEFLAMSPQLRFDPSTVTETALPKAPIEEREISSPIAALMIKRGIPLTVKGYLNFAYPDGLSKPVPAEILEEAREAIRSAKSHIRKRNPGG